jgi:hypothetical protein
MDKTTMTTSPTPASITAWSERLAENAFTPEITLANRCERGVAAGFGIVVMRDA